MPRECQTTTRRGPDFWGRHCEWPREALGGPRRLRETRGGGPGGPGRSREASGGPKKTQEAPGGPGRPREDPGSPGRPQEAPGGPGRPPQRRVLSNICFGRPREDPGSPGRPQEAPGGPGRPPQRRVLSNICFQRSAEYSTASRCKREPLGVVLKSRPARRPSARRPPAVRPRSTEHQVLNSIRLQHNAEYSAASASSAALSTIQHPAARENP